MRFFLLVLLLFATFGSHADQPRYYAGGQIGLSHLDDDGMGDYQDFDNSSGTLSVYGGYQINPYVAFQLNLDMLGGYEGETFTADSYSSYSGLTVSIVPRLPLGDGVSVYGELGGGFVSIYQWVDGLVGPFYYDDETEINTAPASLYGLGFAYDLPAVAGLQLRAGYRKIRFDIDAWAISNAGLPIEREHEQEISQFYAGAAYYFQ